LQVHGNGTINTQMVIRINVMKEIFVGIDFGGTNTKIGCFDSQVNLISKTSIATNAEQGPDEFVRRVGGKVEELLTESGFSRNSIAGIGVGSPGPLNLAEGTIVAAPNLPKFNNTPLRKMISDTLGASVVLENDANAACWGEYTIGAGRGVSDMVFFTLGTGIGGGIISNGELVHGFADDAAELGHIIIYPNGRLCGCGQKGCVEAYASANSTAARAVGALEAGRESSLSEVYHSNGRITCEDVFKHCASGDKLAGEVVDGTAKALGLICVNILHATGPQRIVFAGGMIGAGNLLLTEIRYYFAQYIWSLKDETVEICFATLGEDAGIIGAAALAIHSQKQRVND